MSREDIEQEMQRRQAERAERALNNNSLYVNVPLSCRPIHLEPQRNDNYIPKNTRMIKMYSDNQGQYFSSKQQTVDVTKIDMVTINNCLEFGWNEYYSGWGELVRFERCS